MEENIHITDISTRKDEDNQSMQSLRLEFSEPREDSPNFPEEKSGGEEEEGAAEGDGDRVAVSGVEIKINLSAFDDMEKDTAL